MSKNRKRSRSSQLRRTEIKMRTIDNRAEIRLLGNDSAATIKISRDYSKRYFVATNMASIQKHLIHHGGLSMYDRIGRMRLLLPLISERDKEGLLVTVIY